MRDARAERGELLGVLQELDDLGSSCLASSTPATSAKVTVGLLPVNMRARLLPNDIAWLFDPCAWRIMNSRMAPKKISGRKEPMIPSQEVNWLRLAHVDLHLLVAHAPLVEVGQNPDART